MGRAQDVERLEGWVRSYQPLVYRAACLILRDPAEAEDVAQETFLRAFRRVQVLEAGAAVEPWLFRIAVNLALNRLRSRRREQRALTRVGLDDAASPDPVDRGLTRDLVGEALRQLPDRYRVPLVLRYYLDLSEREMARVLRLPAGTVKSRLHEARRLLAVDRSVAAAAEEG